MREIIKNIFNELVPGIDFECDSLVDSGYISSLVLINLISELDVEFDIEIPFDELITENFNSLNAIEALVEKMINNR